MESAHDAVDMLSTGSASFPDLAGPVLDVWQLPLREGIEEDDYWRTLNPEERARADRFRVTHARRAFLLTRGRLRQLLGEYLDLAPEKVSLVTNDYGKPRLEGTGENQGLVFSVSHSGDLAVLAFARDTSLGVDAEMICVRRDLDGLARQCLSENEWMHWTQLPVARQPGEFIRHWVCKEAFVKATGRGIALGLTRVEVRADFRGFAQLPEPYRPSDNWHLRQWEAGDFRLALAYSGIQREIRFRS